MNKSKIGAIAFGVLFSIFLFEILAQSYYFFIVKKQFDLVKNEPNFYLQKSNNEILGYELKPNFILDKDGKKLQINAVSLREKDNLKAQKKIIGLLGDSVVFGMGQDQDSTISSRLNKQLNSKDSTYYVNLGVPGYNTFQIFEQFKLKYENYKFSEFVYLLNPNDFTTINTVYEGADNGNFRYFNVPFLKTPWFFRKLIYRIHKKGEITFNTDFYKWCFEGTKEGVFNEIEKMNDFATNKNIKFSVLVLPAGSAFTKNGYDLTAMYSEIESNFKQREITYLNPVNSFSSHYQNYFDNTDHFTFEGNTIILKELIKLERQ